jgi:1,4-alpha-glucan branching enzyme
LARWWRNPQELRLRVRPWLLGPALTAAAALVLLVAPRSGSDDRTRAGAPAVAADSTLVRFVFYAPGAQQVTLAGSFNDWSLEAAPLARSDGGVWTITVPLPAGQHEYAFVVDGRRWLPDPAAPTVDDGLGHRNSVMAVGTAQETSL